MNITKILVVDDQQSILALMMQYFEMSGGPYSVMTAANGKIGCRIALESKPDLIVMDWDMPEMNGLDAIKFLKSEEATKNIPVIVATALGSSEHLAEALGAGAIDYVRKPVDKIELLARVRSALELTRSYNTIVAQKEELQRLVRELQEAAEKIKTLSGLVPICSWCKKIRDDKGYWAQIESYIQEHSEAKFSHGICPDCKTKLYEEFRDTPPHGR